MNIIIKKQYLFIICELLFSWFTFGQIKEDSSHPSGSPSTLKIIRFYRNDFKADSQFLTMCESEDGTLF